MVDHIRSLLLNKYSSDSRIAAEDAPADAVMALFGVVGDGSSADESRVDALLPLAMSDDLSSFRTQFDARTTPRDSGSVYRADSDQLSQTALYEKVFGGGLWGLGGIFDDRDPYVLSVLTSLRGASSSTDAAFALGSVLLTCAYRRMIAMQRGSVSIDPCARYDEGAEEWCVCKGWCWSGSSCYAYGSTPEYCECMGNAPGTEEYCRCLMYDEGCPEGTHRDEETCECVEDSESPSSSSSPSSSGEHSSSSPGSSSGSPCGEYEEGTEEYCTCMYEWYSEEWCDCVFPGYPEDACNCKGKYWCERNEECKSTPKEQCLCEEHFWCAAYGECIQHPTRQVWCDCVGGFWCEASEECMETEKEQCDCDELCWNERTAHCFADDSSAEGCECLGGCWNTSAGTCHYGTLEPCSAGTHRNPPACECVPD